MGARGDSAALRSLPAVHELAGALDAPHTLAVAAARRAIDEQRAAVVAGVAPTEDLLPRARELLAEMERPSLRRVINATGVILHTNLGRAPLAAAAREAVARAAEGYSNLELDLESGERGSRHAHVEALLCELTGAEAAIVVNNGAAAVLLAAAAIAGPGRGIVVSRGQLVEIGGGFRIPEVIAQSGARLVEVGTTNRTRLERLRPRDRDARRHRRDPARPPVELPHGGVRRGRGDRGAVRAGGAGDRRRGFGLAGQPASLVCEGRGGGRAGPERVRGRWRGDRVLLGRQAARRATGRADRRPARGGRGGAPASAGTGAADRQALACRARGDAPPVPRSRTRGARDPGAGDAGGR